MIDWQERVERPRLVCSRSGEPIGPGEVFYSALLIHDGRFERRDFAEAGWEEEDPDAYLSWWRQRRSPERRDDRPRIVNHAVLLSIFHDLKDSRERPQQCFAWLLALLLTRSRKLRYLDLQREGEDSYLLVEERGKGQAFRIRDPRMSSTEEECVQENLREIFDMPAGAAPSSAE